MNYTEQKRSHISLITISVKGRAMQAFRLPIILILVYLPLHCQEGFPLVRTCPAKLSFPDHVIPLFSLSDFKLLVEKKLYQMAFDTINGRILDSNECIGVAILASETTLERDTLLESEANIEFIRAILEHRLVQQRYTTGHHEIGLWVASVRGYWEVYHFLNEYADNTALHEFFLNDYALKHFERLYGFHLIMALGGGFFNFVFNELRWREISRTRWEVMSERKPLRLFWYARTLSNPNTWIDPYVRFTKDSGAMGRKKNYSLVLHVAVDRNLQDIMIFLLQNEADPCKEDHEEDTALSIAQRKGYTDIEKIFRLFIRYRDFITQINTGKNSHEFTSKLLEACPALASHCLKDIEGNTSLHHAVKADDPELITTLLERDPLLALEANKYGFSPLECSFLNGNHEALKAILAYAYRTYTCQGMF